MKIAITGHRPNKLGNDYDLISGLIMRIRNRLHEIVNEQKPTFMISGMALGIDTLWAELAIELDIPLIAAVPFEGQEVVWPNKSKARYRTIIESAHKVINVSNQIGYKPEYMQLRNKWMVDNCDILIAVWDGSSGGTCNCIQYAKDKKKIIYIDPKLFI
jgi:uncharacterized phage-like protein YoqJ